MTTATPNDTTTELWVLLNKTQRSLSARVEKTLKRHGLPNHRWYDILWGLEHLGKDAGLRQYQLEEFSLFDQPNLSRIVKQMTEQGLITQTCAPNDKRGRVLHITDQGRALRSRMWAIYSDLMLQNIEDKLSYDTAQQVIEALKLLQDA